MVLYEKPFNNCFAHAIFALGSALKYPQFWLVNKLLSYWRETTAEREWRVHEGPCYERGCVLMLSFVFGLVALIAFLPFTIVGYFLWLLGLRFRNPFIYSSNANKLVETAGPPILTGRSVAILSLNAKLLPESRSRTFNLAHVSRRARQIASIVIHGSSVGGQGKNSGEPSYAGKNSFAVTSGPHGDSISQVSYGYLEKSAAYCDNLSENRSLVSGAAVDVVVSGVGSQGGNQSNHMPNGESFSLGGGRGGGGAGILNPNQNLAPDQITVTSLKSVEGMWQRRSSHQVKTDSCITLKSDVPIKQLAVGGPGSSHTLESLQSESRSRIDEPNPSTMSLSSRVHGIPAVSAQANNIQNGSVVLSVGSGSGNEGGRPVATRMSLQSANQSNQPLEANGDVDSSSAAGMLGPQSSQGGAAETSSNAQADLPSLSCGTAAGVGFSTAIYLPSDCPSVDVVCLQEVSDSRANDIVKNRLLTAFPHILHSAKLFHGFKSCPVTTGNLVIASKFPILNARYHEQLTPFGKRSLLAAKVLLQHAGEQKIVAIVGNVYVKRRSPFTLLEPADFDNIVKWLRRFRNDTISSDVTDVLNLDVCAGYIDFPTDGALVNEILQHEFFSSYVSPAMHTAAGDSLFGAELHPLVLHDSEISRPDTLHHTLFRYHPNGPKLSQLFRRLSDVAGETAPFSLLRTSFLRYCRDTTDTSGESDRNANKNASQPSSSTSRGNVTTAFAGLTTHLALTASFQQPQ